MQSAQAYALLLQHYWQTILACKGHANEHQLLTWVFFAAAVATRRTTDQNGMALQLAVLQGTRGIARHWTEGVAIAVSATSGRLLTAQALDQCKILCLPTYSY
jgi:hypothetical protein